jgi:uncharacterized membrane protein YjgN (DUF898 family)
MSEPIVVPAAGGYPQGHGLGYDGRAGEIFGIALTNGLLTLVTLGVYRFWGKTRLRRYFWGHVSFLGDRLEYAGRAMELFLGFAVVVLVLAPLIGASYAINLIFPESFELIAAKEGLQVLVIYFLVYYAIFRARRYRLSRTQWRGIRCGQTGSAAIYAWLAIWTSILMVFSFGLAFPYYRMVLKRYEVRNTWFGDRSLQFDGRARDLFWQWLVALVLFAPSLGTSYVWYQVVEFRYVALKTRYRSLRFRSELRTIQVVLIYLMYGAVALVSIAIGIIVVYSFAPQDMVMGIATTTESTSGIVLETIPKLVVVGALVVVAVWLNILRMVLFMHPFFRVVCNTMTIFGDEDYAAIAQSQQAAPARGEGLADALDVGAI